MNPQATALKLKKANSGGFSISTIAAIFLHGLAFAVIGGWIVFEGSEPSEPFQAVGNTFVELLEEADVPPLIEEFSPDSLAGQDNLVPGASGGAGAPDLSGPGGAGTSTPRPKPTASAIRR